MYKLTGQLYAVNNISYKTYISYNRKLPKATRYIIVPRVLKSYKLRTSKKEIR